MSPQCMTPMTPPSHRSPAFTQQTVICIIFLLTFLLDNFTEFGKCSKIALFHCTGFFERQYPRKTSFLTVVWSVVIASESKQSPLVALLFLPCAPSHLPKCLPNVKARLRNTSCAATDASKKTYAK